MPGTGKGVLSGARGAGAEQSQGRLFAKGGWTLLAGQEAVLTKLVDQTAQVRPLRAMMMKWVKLEGRELALVTMMVF